MHLTNSFVKHVVLTLTFCSLSISSWSTETEMLETLVWFWEVEMWLLLHNQVPALLNVKQFTQLTFSGNQGMRSRWGLYFNRNTMLEVGSSCYGETWPCDRHPELFLYKIVFRMTMMTTVSLWCKWPFQPGNDQNFTVIQKRPEDPNLGGGGWYWGWMGHVLHYVKAADVSCYCKVVTVCSGIDPQTCGGHPGSERL